jgi:hypothetical protein
MAKVTMVVNRMAWSRGRFLLKAESIARGIAKTTDTAVAYAVSRRVEPSRGQIKLATGDCCSVENPKFSCRALVRKLQYWEGSDRSRPKVFRSAATALRLALARPFHGFRGSGELKDAKVAFP